MSKKDDQIIYTIPAAIADRFCKQEGFSKSPHGVNTLDPIHARFIRRGDAETNPKFRQVIPYIVVTRATDDRVGLEVLRYTRTKQAGEDRLHAKTSIGLGGHMEKFDGDFRASLWRELALEELNLSDKRGKRLTFEDVGLDAYHAQYCGVIKSSASEVDSVHLGVVFTIRLPDRLIKVDTSDTSIAGLQWVGEDTLRSSAANLESWSRLILDADGSVRETLRPVFPEEPGGRMPQLSWHATYGMIARPSPTGGLNYDPVRGKSAELASELVSVFAGLRSRMAAFDPA